jgi:predicted house-cleaning noncanonical NTP pyrophosphatase (MazG superfamily)
MGILTVVETRLICKELCKFITSYSTDHLANTMRVISNYIQSYGSEKWLIIQFYVSFMAHNF